MNIDFSTLFPDEIFEEILLRLQVGDLLRLRGVCKSWCGLIDNPGFIKNQHRKRHAILKEEGDMPLLLDGFGGHLYNNLYLLSKRFGDITLCLTACSEHDSAREHLHLAGVVNGIVLLVLHRFPHSRSTCLWNPATKEFKHVPPRSYPYDDVLGK